MLRQLQPFAQRFSLFHAVRADQAQVIEVCFCDGFSLYSAFLVAVVGETGSGKTTIANLIARFYDVTGGAV